MATLASLTNDVFDMLYGIAQVERPAEDTLNTAVSGTGDVEWRFDTESMWNRGDLAEDKAAGELVIMAEDHPSGADITVRRGERNTTAAASYAIGDVFYKNPRFPRHIIERFINETVDKYLYPDVWMWGQTTVTWVDGQTNYEMPTDCAAVVDVYQVIDSKTYPVADGNWEWKPVVNTAESTNGNFLRLFGGLADSTETIYVTYRQKPSSDDLTTMSDDVASLVPWKVVGQLLAGTRVGPVRVAPGRAQPVTNQATGVKQDSAYFDVEFRRARLEVKKTLRKQMKDIGRRTDRRKTRRRG